MTAVEVTGVLLGKLVDIDEAALLEGVEEDIADPALLELDAMTVEFVLIVAAVLVGEVEAVVAAEVIGVLLDELVDVDKEVLLVVAKEDVIDRALLELDAVTVELVLVEGAVLAGDTESVLAIEVIGVLLDELFDVDEEVVGEVDVTNPVLLELDTVTLELILIGVKLVEEAEIVLVVEVIGVLLVKVIDVDEEVLLEMTRRAALELESAV